MIQNMGNLQATYDISISSFFSRDNWMNNSTSSDKSSNNNFIDLNISEENTKIREICWSTLFMIPDRKEMLHCTIFVLKCRIVHILYQYELLISSPITNN